ncbi:DUF3796 domain-containing protein [Sporosarcina sp. Sa2YVA2]|uniref:DUF3796 domain-containing protein n=1 Tax=Sporosarcina quadrami TaxID=2762234 RepID=A0ABR8UDF2_9BACL|nr:DUF3796 domain-containing protein [Sporosarcina quadrami]MBD7985860.1 DUF3796 domain-containing protein [Sporosarcina quadrami]
MYEGFDIWSFLVGLPLGLTIWAVMYYFVWKKGKKERIFDERYQNIHRHARSISWKVMTGALLIAWIIVMIVEGPRLAFFIITALWIIHMISWGIGAFIVNEKY